VGLLEAARAHAIVAGRAHVTPDDVQAVLVPALAHRVSVGGVTSTDAARPVLQAILAATPVPTP
jgi:MoxR-like ATPase